MKKMLFVIVPLLAAVLALPAHAAGSYADPKTQISVQGVALPATAANGQFIIADTSGLVNVHAAVLAPGTVLSATYTATSDTLSGVYAVVTDTANQPEPRPLLFAQFAVFDGQGARCDHGEGEVGYGDPGHLSGASLLGNGCHTAGPFTAKLTIGVDAQGTTNTQFNVPFQIRSFYFQ